nr:hypothetical protein [Nocardia abscessus]
MSTTAMVVWVAAICTAMATLSAVSSASGLCGLPIPEAPAVSGSSTISPASSSARVCQVTVAGEMPACFAIALRGAGPSSSNARSTAPALPSAIAVTSSSPRCPVTVRTRRAGAKISAQCDPNVSGRRT